MTSAELANLRRIADGALLQREPSRRVLVELLAVYDAADTLCRTPLGDGEAQARLALEAMMGVIRP